MGNETEISPKISIDLYNLKEKKLNFFFNSSFAPIKHEIKIPLLLRY